MIEPPEDASVVTKAKRVYDEATLQFVVDAIPNAALVVDARGVLVVVNARAEELFGHPAVSLVGRPIETLVPKQFAAAHVRHRERFRARPRARSMGPGAALFAVRSDGTEVPVDIGLQPIPSGDGVMVLASVVDLRPRRAAEEELRAREERVLMALQFSKVGLWDSNPTTGEVFFSREWKSQLGYAEDELPDRFEEWEKRLHPDDLGPTLARVRSLIEGTAPDYEVEFRLRHRDGTYRWIYSRAALVRDVGGAPLRAIGCHVDVTARREAEEQLRLENALRTILMRTSGEGMFAEVLDMVRRHFGSPFGFFGYIRDSDGALVCPSMTREVWDKCDVEAKSIDFPRTSWGGLWGRILVERVPLIKNEAHRTPEGHILLHRSMGAPILRDGKLIGSIHLANREYDYLASDRVALQHICDVLAPPLELWLRRREAEARTQLLEEQLRQAQKMEALGQLAGGVAHDFNNLLTSIVMQVDSANGVPELPADVREALRDIQCATDRAAALTRQLLMFSRRQVMQPRTLDLNVLVTDLAKLLERIIGEDIALDVRLHPKPLLTRADPGMIDQVLMNLSVNARDAMPVGGRLRIQTAEVVVDDARTGVTPDVTPGRYASLEVTDTGHGISIDVAPHIFEPFFTTKESGKGSGLGLATVFGIVKQHAGFISFRSEVGNGALFQVLLPSVGDTLPSAKATDVASPERGTETLLLVEDDEALRRLAQRSLERFGYRVLAAADGPDAVALFTIHNREIALLITDMVMPCGMSGHALAQRLRESRPLPVVFMSGYSAEIAGQELSLQPGEYFIQKPFNVKLLLTTVREALHSRLKR